MYILPLIACIPGFRTMLTHKQSDFVATASYLLRDPPNDQTGAMVTGIIVPTLAFIARFYRTSVVTFFKGLPAGRGIVYGDVIHSSDIAVSDHFFSARMKKYAEQKILVCVPSFSDPYYNSTLPCPERNAAVWKALLDTSTAAPLEHAKLLGVIMSSIIPDSSQTADANEVVTICLETELGGQCPVNGSEWTTTERERCLSDILVNTADDLPSLDTLVSICPII